MTGLFETGFCPCLGQWLIVAVPLPLSFSLHVQGLEDDDERGDGAQDRGSPLEVEEEEEEDEEEEEEDKEPDTGSSVILFEGNEPG